MGILDSLSPELAKYIPRIVQIESGGNPNAQTGSYKGLLQMGPQEWAKYGNGADINDPQANLAAGVAKMRDEANGFQQQYGRQPTPTEFYLLHQQGAGGLGAHLANPDAPAWENMAGTGEGRQKGSGWAKQAIWGNVPSDVRAQYPGGVDSLTSRQFMDIWKQKVERGGQASPQAQSSEAPQAIPPLQAAPIFAPSAAPQPQPQPQQAQQPAEDYFAQMPVSPMTQFAQAPPIFAPPPRKPPDLSPLLPLLNKAPVLRGLIFRG